MIPMHLRLHWPFIRNNFICTSNISQISASLIFLLTRKTAQFIIVQIIALDIYKCITKSNLQEARAEMFLFDIFVVVVVAAYLFSNSRTFSLKSDICDMWEREWGCGKDRLRSSRKEIPDTLVCHKESFYIFTYQSLA